MPQDEGSQPADGPSGRAPAPPVDPAAAAPDEDRYPAPRPTNEPEAITSVRATIELKLKDMLDRYVVDERGNYVFGLESALVYVVPAWLESKTTVVRVFAITNLDVPVTPELTLDLLEKNLDFVLGAFALDAGHGAVWFNHNLLGEFLAPDELEATLAAVAETANKYDDEIKERFGGRLYAESPERSVPPPHTPGYL